jgi:hypothetical protein
MKNEEKRMAGDYEIRHAIHIGDKEIVFGENMKDPKGLFYFVGNYAHNDFYGSYEEKK